MLWDCVRKCIREYCPPSFASHHSPVVTNPPHSISRRATNLPIDATIHHYYILLLKEPAANIPGLTSRITETQMYERVCPFTLNYPWL